MSRCRLRRQASLHVRCMESQEALYEINEPTRFQQESFCSQGSPAKKTSKSFPHEQMDLEDANMDRELCPHGVSSSAKRTELMPLCCLIARLKIEILNMNMTFITVS